MVTQSGLPRYQKKKKKPKKKKKKKKNGEHRAVQSQKMARSLKFRIYVGEELYYPSSENKGADQLRGYREADLRLCFRICRLLGFS